MHARKNFFRALSMNCARDKNIRTRGKGNEKTAADKRESDLKESVGSIGVKL